mgnify:FL=1
MFLVLMVHYIPSRPRPDTQSVWEFLPEEVFTVLLHSIAVICVNCFVLISGYFGIRWKWRSFSNLIFQIVFWFLLDSILAYCLGDQPQTIALAFFTNFPQRWFIAAYIGLYVIAPVLNAFIEKCDEKALLHMLLAYYAYSTLFGYIGHTPDMNEGMSVISLMGLYFVGAYLKKASWTERFTAKNYFAAFSTCVLLLATASLSLLCIGVSNSPLGYLNPLVILESAMLFMTFKRLNVRGGTAIRFFASSIFAVYLFHIHSLIYRRYIDTCDRIVSESNSFTLALCFMLTVMLTAVLIDKVRLWLFETLWTRKGV